MSLRLLSLLFALALATSATACGPSFANVKATARLGQGLAQYPIATNVWIAECQASLVALPTNQFVTVCTGAPYRGTVEGVRQASLLLQKYASSLLDATGADDVTTADSVTAVLDQFGALKVDTLKQALPRLYNLAEVIATDAKLVGKLTPSSVNELVDTLVRFATRAHRRKALASTIRTAAPHVDALLRVIEAEARLHLATLEDLRQTMAYSLVARPLSDAPDEQLKNLAQSGSRTLALVGVTLDQRIDSLKRLSAACQAFRIAHEKLAARIEQDRPWQNGELLRELKTSLELVIKTMNS